MASIFDYFNDDDDKKKKKVKRTKLKPKKSVKKKPDTILSDDGDGDKDAEKVRPTLKKPTPKDKERRRGLRLTDQYENRDLSSTPSPTRPSLTPMGSQGELDLDPNMAYTGGEGATTPAGTDAGRLKLNPNLSANLAGVAPEEEGEESATKPIKKTRAQTLREEMYALEDKPLEDKDSKVMNYLKGALTGAGTAYMEARRSGASSEEALYSALGGGGSGALFGGATKEGRLHTERRERETELERMRQKLYPAEARQDLEIKRSQRDRSLKIDAERNRINRERVRVQSDDRRSALQERTKKRESTERTNRIKSIEARWKELDSFDPTDRDSGHEALAKEALKAGIVLPKRDPKLKSDLEHDKESGDWYVIYRDEQGQTVRWEAVKNKDGSVLNTTSGEALSTKTRVSEGAKDRAHREKMVAIKAKIDEKTREYKTAEAEMNNAQNAVQKAEAEKIYHERAKELIQLRSDAKKAEQEHKSQLDQ